MNNGWIKLHRKLQDNPIFYSDKGLRVWLWCLFKAGHQDKKIYLGNKKILLKEGQFVTGRLSASEELKLSPSTLRNWLDTLKQDNYLDIKTTNKYSIITILNWQEYQTKDSKKDNKITSNYTTKRHQTIQQNNTNKKDKKDKKDKNSIQATPEEHKNIISIFDIFKKINPTIDYGHRTNRKACLELIKKFGLEDIKKIATYAVQVQGQQYAPTITTPWQLKEKLAQLKIYADKSNKFKIRSL